MDTKMTYEQIEREFDELFVKKVMLIDEPDKLAYEEMKYQVEPEAIKSFLKQSFIKYLQEQLEVTKRQQADPFTKSEDFLDGFALCKSVTIAKLEAQIKELEV